MTERGWAKTPSDLIRARLLTWVSESTRDGRLPPVSGFAEQQVPIALDADTLKPIVAGLESDGLVHINRSMGGILSMSLQLTGSGHQQVSRMRERLNDDLVRAQQCREAVLYWLYKREQYAVTAPEFASFFLDVASFFEGQPFLEHEAEQAVRYLNGKGLVEIPDNVPWSGRRSAFADITPAGVDCVEQFGGSVIRYLREARERGNVTFHNHGDNYGQQAAGHTVNQQQNVGDPDALLAALADLRRDLDEADAPDKGRMLGLVQVIEDEATSTDPDRGAIKSNSNRLKQIASKAENAAITSTVGIAVAAIVKFIAGG